MAQPHAGPTGGARPADVAPRQQMEARPRRASGERPREPTARGICSDLQSLLQGCSVKPQQQEGTLRAARSAGVQRCVVPGPIGAHDAEVPGWRWGRTPSTYINNTACTRTQAQTLALPARCWILSLPEQATISQPHHFGTAPPLPATAAVTPSAARSPARAAFPRMLRSPEPAVPSCVHPQSPLPPAGLYSPYPNTGHSSFAFHRDPVGWIFFFFLNDSGFAQQSNRCSGLRLQTCRAGTGWGPRLPLSAAARPHSPRNSSSSRRGAQPPLSAPPPMPAPSAPSPTRAEAANLRRSRRWREKSLPALSSFFPPPIFLPSPRPPAAPRTH